MEEVCAALPFDTIGCTTSIAGVSTASGNTYGNFTISLMVLTSDDVKITVDTTGEADTAERLYAATDGVKSRITEKFGKIPEFMIMNAGGWNLFSVSDIIELFPETEVFGTQSITDDLKNMYVFCNGKKITNGYAVVALSGEVQRKYIQYAVSPKKFIRQEAIVTKCSKNILQEVNHIPAEQYFLGLGFNIADLTEGGSETLAMIQTLSDGSIVARALSHMDSETGFATSNGNFYEGANLSVSLVNYDSIVENAQQAAETIQEAGLKNALVFTCIGRQWALCAKDEDEIIAFTDRANGFNYLFAYSGGEICPTKTTDGKLINNFHNLTLTACVFE
jgi:hypothetical protein